MGASAESGRWYGSNTELRSGGIEDGEVSIKISVACSVFW